jgi:dipeptidyl aminopeptidase/acylaminoacyl peptidase
MRIDRRGRGAAVLLSLLTLAGTAPTGAQEGTKRGYAGFGADSVTSETLQKFAPPPIDPALRTRIERMMDIRSPAPGRLAPNGSALYFSWGVTGTQQIWRVDGPKGFPVQLTGGDDGARLVDITPDGRHLVVSRDSGGDEQFGLYLQDARGGPLQTIFQAPKVRAIHELVTEDSRSIYYAANDVRPDSFAIYRHDIESGKREVVFDREGLWSIADHRPDGRFLLAREKGALYSDYYEWRPGSEQLIPVLGQDETVEYLVAFGARDDEYVVSTNKFGEFRRLYSYRKGKFEPITPEQPHDVAYFTIDLARRRIVYGVNRDGYLTPGALDAKTYEALELPAFPDADNVRIGLATRDGRVALFTVETAKAPDVTYTYDWSSRKLTEWVVPSTPEVDTRGFVRAVLEKYPARDGTEIPMFVWRSEECRERVCPVIVNFHGGPEAQARPGFNPQTELFVDAGFVWVQPNVRGSDGYGKSWLAADDGPHRLDVITDIADCAAYIKQAWARGGVTPKVGIYGGSYGGYSTLAGMTMFAGSYDAGVAVVGMSNLLTFLENTAPYRRILRASEYGDPEKDRDALERLSPIRYVDRVEDPVLILHGATDPRVPVGEAIQFYERVAERDVPAALIIFPDEGHGVRKRPNRVLSTGHVLGFFEKHLR